MVTYGLRKNEERQVTMTNSDDSRILSVVHPICCGMDVHKDTVCACLSWTGPDGRAHQEQRTFSCFTDHLYRLRDWLEKRECPVVAMESTGVYWQPVYNVLEGGFDVQLVNARHIKNVPGRKTDVLDSQWLAGLLRHGLLKGSYIPSKDFRQMRDLTRCRRNFVESLSDEKRRVHKLLQSANIKIDTVVSDLFGVTGRNLMALLLKKTRRVKLSEVEECVRGKLKDKGRELHRSIQGFFEKHHQFLLKTHLSIIKSLEKQIRAIERRLAELFAPHEELIARMIGVPGISIIASYGILSEIGLCLDTFPSAAHLSSWSGACPGNNESAGKRRSGKSPVRRNHLKTLLVEVAWAAVKKKGSYYKAKFYSLRARRGPKRAIMAIAHRILKAVYFIVKNGATYRELGEDYLAQRKKDSKLSYLRREARKVGYTLVADQAAQARGSV